MKNLTAEKYAFVSPYTQSKDIEKVCKSNNVPTDFIFHEGVWSSAPHYESCPFRVGRAIEEFTHVLEYAMAANARVVYASSSSIYNGLPTPHKEKQVPKITSLYTEARIGMERMSKFYWENFGVESIGLRYFSVYGRKEKWKGKCANLISQFVWAMQKKEAPLIYGDGSQTRDFIHVSDVVEANILASEKGKPGEVYNVGTGRSYSLNDVVREIGDILPDMAPNYIENTSKNYVQHTLADTKKTEKDLGFRAKISLKKGILDIL